MKHLSLGNFDAVAFDIEGTLANTIPTHHAARLKAFREHGYEHITPEQHALGPIYGSTTADIVGGVLHAAGAIEAQTPYNEHPVVQGIMATKTRYFGELATKGFDEMPGATNFFKDVAKYFSKKTALVTASSQVFIQPFIDRYQLGPLLAPDLIITEETINTLGLQPKPAADAYQLAQKRLKARHLLVFEDTVSGVASAKAAGATVVALGFEPHNARLFTKGGLQYMPDYFVTDYTAARQLFDELS